MIDPNGSWFLWKFLRGIEWKALPEEGGLLDQNDAIMQDLGTIGWQAALIENMLRADGKIGTKPDG